MRKFAVVVFLCSAFSGLVSTAAASQGGHEDPKWPLPDSPSAQIPSTQVSHKQQVSVVILLTRRSYFFPDLATDTAPLSPGHKFTLFLDDSISGHAIAGSAVGAGVGEALNWTSGYGQGFAGYGKRFGSYMARTASSSLFGTFLFATAFRQDPRFFVRSRLTFWQAAKYSAYRVVITRRDSGEETVNSSGLLGPLAGEGLANAYLPTQNRTLSNTFFRYATDIGLGYAGNFLRQYWPTLSKRLLPPKRTQKKGIVPSVQLSESTRRLLRDSSCGAARVVLRMAD